MSQVPPSVGLTPGTKGSARRARTQSPILSPRGELRASGGRYWFAVKELNINYHGRDIFLYVQYITWFLNYGNQIEHPGYLLYIPAMVIYVKFLNSNPGCPLPKPFSKGAS